jgi:hypothetical protein
MGTTLAGCRSHQGMARLRSPQVGSTMLATGPCREPVERAMNLGIGGGACPTTPRLRRIKKSGIP